MKLVLKLQCLLKKSIFDIWTQLSNNDSRFHILVTSSVDIYKCWLTMIHDRQALDELQLSSAAKKTGTIKVSNAVAKHKTLLR